MTTRALAHASADAAAICKDDWFIRMRRALLIFVRLTLIMALLIAEALFNQNHMFSSMFRLLLHVRVFLTGIFANKQIYFVMSYYRNNIYACYGPLS